MSRDQDYRRPAAPLVSGHAPVDEDDLGPELLLAGAAPLT
jgi:hypothetical protein